ncbi:MAG: carbohydrate-binding domain-containing protein [Bacteroidales bacterium]|nr:carbohydrate-binding domain-containing protein [Bacteroidales bacterium]
MKRTIILAVVALMVSWSASAQERYVNVYSGGTVVYSSTTSGSNSITFSGSNAVFNHNGTAWSSAISSIDSMIFSTSGSIYQYADTAICSGESLSFYGTTITSAGTYTHDTGNDTIEVLTVAINPTYRDTTTYTAIGSYLWQGSTYTTSGTYTTRLTSSKGCDSVLVLVLTVNATPSGRVVLSRTADICEGGTYTFYDTTLTTAGMYSHSISNDTSVVLTLTVNPVYKDTATVSATGSYTWHDSTFTASTVYTLHLTSVAGCDSALTLALTINSSSSQTDTGSAVRITWDGTSTTVVNPYATRGITVTASGGHVVVASTIDSSKITYILSGTSSNGSLTLTTDSAIVMRLNSLTLTSPSSSAISISSSKKTTVELVGTSTLSDGTSSTGKGTLQTTDKFTFQGSGTLNVSGLKKHGIQSSGKTTISSGTINILTAVKDGMNVDNFVMNGGTVNVTNPNGDGIDADQGYIKITDGTISINCSGNDVKGLCCDSTLTISGGNITIALSGYDSKGIKSDSAMFLNGGTIEITSTGDTCKGISCNSTLTITGGTATITVSGLASKGIKTDGNLVVNGGNTTVKANGTVYIANYEPSYCTGVKVDGMMRMLSGSLTATCASTNAGGKAISADGNIVIGGGTLSLTAQGTCAKYQASSSTYDSYSSQCLKSNGSITISGGTVTATAGGRAINADKHYTQTGGTVTTSTSASGFTITGSGTSCTDGFAPACLKADSNITFTAGSFSGTSTGTGGRGIVGDSLLTVGTLNAENSLLQIYVTTSGAAVNATSSNSSSDYWKGLPKGVKIEGNIVVNSGYLQSYCSQTSGDPTGEAIETKDSLFVHGGYVEANAYDDAINADTYIKITGGYVWAYARGNDGMDCNGSRIDVSGGTLICRGTEVAIDDNGDHGGKLYVTGGTIVLIGGNMGTTEATPSVSNQKSLTLGSSSSGGMTPPGQGGSSTSNLATNGFTVKNSSSTAIFTFKWPTFTGSGFESVASSSSSTKGGGGGGQPGGGQSGSKVWITSPSITSGSYTYFSSPTISGGISWHGLYSGATVTTSGSGTSVTAQ